MGLGSLQLEFQTLEDSGSYGMSLVEAQTIKGLKNKTQNMNLKKEDVYRCWVV